MTDKLHGDDGFFARLLGSSLRPGDRLFGADLPVVLLLGAPGTGKGRLLGEVLDGFRSTVPIAHVDFAQPLFENRVDGRTRTRSEATEVLREIGIQLQEWKGVGGGLRFPRLYAGLAAVAACDDSRPADGLASEVHRHDPLLPKGSFRGHLVPGMAARVARAYLNAALNAFASVAAPFLNVLLDVLFERLTSGTGDALHSCYGNYQGANGQAKLGLLRLAADFRLGGAEREKAEGFLFRALREDVEACYSSMQGKLVRTSARPAVILEHSELPQGRRLVKAVLRDRQSGLRDRLVVVGTACRADGGRFLDVDPSDVPARWSPLEDAFPPQWTRPAGGLPESAPPWHGVLLVEAPMLTVAQQDDLAAGLVAEGADLPARMLGALHRLSGGRRLVEQLARAVARTRLPDEESDRALYDAQVPVLADGDTDRRRAVGGELLDALITRRLPGRLAAVHHARWLDLLSVLSIAHDLTCAEELLRPYQRPDDELSAYDIAELLDDCGWGRCPRHFIGDFGLRQLLLHRLADGGEGAEWIQGHTRLWNHYRRLSERTPGQPDELFGSAAAHALHHHLAFADSTLATQYLVAAMPPADAERPAPPHRTRTAQQWSAELLAIAEAPVLKGADAVHDLAIGQSVRSADSTEHRVERVLNAVRLASDPTRPTPQDVADSVTKLKALNSRWPAATTHFNAQAAEWQRAAVRGRPLLPCTCTQHIG